MILDYRRAGLRELIDDIGEATATARDALQPLSPAQLNWQPHPAEWSAAQALEHMVMTNAGYDSQFESLLRGDHRPTPAERVPILPAFNAALLLRALNPAAPVSMRTTRAFEPSASAIDPAIVARFEESQARILVYAISFLSRDLAGLRVTSPFARYVAYGLLDAFRILAAHTRVHLAQALRVLAAPGFPD
jgi:hypothetical protein